MAYIEQIFAFIVNVGIIVCAVALAVFFLRQSYRSTVLRERARSGQLRALAERLGLEFFPPTLARASFWRVLRGPAWNQPSGYRFRHGFLNSLRVGFNRYPFNVMRGQYYRLPVELYEYHYSDYEGYGKSRRRVERYLTVFAITLPGSHPQLLVYPETLKAKWGAWFGGGDIEFDSLEFSRAFVVSCWDKKFAYDVCNPQMMEFLLRNRDVSLEIEYNCLALCVPGRLPPDHMLIYLNLLVEIRERLPDYLFRP